MKPTRNTVVALAALIFSIAALSVSLSLDTTDDGQGHKTRTITFHVDRSGAPGTQTGTVSAPAPVVAAIKPNLETNLQAPPQGTPQAQLEHVADAEDAVRAALPPLPTAGATAGVPGCRTQFVVNQSSRHGVRPTQFWLHYTVSPNVPGWGDVNAVVGLFNRSSSQASSHFVLDAEGHCAYIVPLEAKAWTQAASNPFAVSVEVIATGKETTYCPGPCMKQLRVIARTVSARTGIPLHAGRVSNCTPALSGIVQHFDGGLCSGGHTDIKPFPVDAVVTQIAAGVRTPKKVVWIRHRKAVHLQYVARCPRGHGNTDECKALRARARKLDQLIARR